MKDLWSLLADAAKENKVVQISLAPGANVKRAKRPSAGRPRHTFIRFSNYAGYEPETRGRPRCAFRGCEKHLRKDQPVACSPEHEAEVIGTYERRLAKVKGARP